MPQWRAWASGGWSPLFSEGRLEQLQGSVTALAQMSLGAVLALWWFGGEVAYAAGCRLVSGDACAVVRQAESVSMVLAVVAGLGFLAAFAIEAHLDNETPGFIGVARS